MRTWLIRLACTAAAMALAVGCAATAAAAPAPPSSDPFYAYSGSLANLAPGTVLKTRQVRLSVSGLSTPYPATQVLYRTTTQLGAPEVTVATIIKPPTYSLGKVKLLSYQIAYDCDTPTGRPSYQLEGGTPASVYVTLEAGPMLSYLAEGYTVVTSDYEGPDDEWGAGQTSGYATLDAILAADHVLDVPDSTPAGLVGYSGGSIATMWAVQEQPTYAPELHIFGAAAGGIPVDYASLINYVDGTSSADVIPSVLLGLFKAYGFDYGTYLNATGIADMKTAGQECLSSSFGDFTLTDILKPQYQDWEQVPALDRILNDEIMGNGATPTEPLLIGAADLDGIGDGLMIDGDMRQLADEYCQRGVSVVYQVYRNLDHFEGDEVFNTQAPIFLGDAYAGDAPDRCSSVTPGDALTPLPVPAPAHGTPRLILHVLGVTTRSRGLVVELRASTGALDHVSVELTHAGKIREHVTLARLGTKARRIVLRSHGRAPVPGHYTLAVVVDGRETFHRSYVVPKR